MIAFAGGLAIGFLVFCWWRARSDTRTGSTMAAIARGLLPICLVLAVCSALLDVSSVTVVTPIVVMAIAGADIAFVLFVAARGRPDRVAS